MSSGSLSFMLEKEPVKKKANNCLDVSDHCVTVATTDSIHQNKERRASKNGKSRRGARRPAQDNNTNSSPALGSFVEEMNESFSGPLTPDMSDLQTVDSRSPNLSASRRKLSGDRPKRKPMQRTNPNSKALPVTFGRGF